MILFNQDKIKLNYHIKDNLVFNIFSLKKMENILDDLLQGKSIDEIGGIQAYYINKDKTNFNSNLDEHIKDMYEIYNIRKEDSYIPDYNVVHDSEYEGDVTTGDEYHAEHFAPNSTEPYMITNTNENNKIFQDFLFNVDNNNEIIELAKTENTRKALINQLAATLGIIPQLIDYYPDKNVSELKKLSELAELTIDMGIADFYSKEYNELIPNKETIDILNGLSVAERQLLTCEMNAAKVTDLCVQFKKQNPGQIFTRDLIESYFYKHLNKDDNLKTKINTNDNVLVNNWTSVKNKSIELFNDSKEYGHRPPRVIEEYVTAQLNKNPRITGNEIYNNFNLKSLMKVAKLNSEILLAICDEINFQEIKDSHRDIIATLYPKELVGYLKDNKFIEYYNKHRNMSDNELKELLENYRNVYNYAMEIKNSIDTGVQHYAHSEDYDMSLVKFDDKKAPIKMIDELKTYKAIQDCKGLEREYNYKFINNDLAIKGRNIEIIDRNYHMYMLPADDYRNFTIGYDTNCCQHYGGAGASCVYKLTSDPYAGAVVIEKNGKVIAQGFVWTDESKDLLVFDNVEFNNDRDVYLFNNIFSGFAKHCPYSNIHVGTSYNEGMQGWGASVSTKDLGVMPTTVNGGRHIYSDYVGHSNARTIKKNGKVLLPESNCQIITHDLIPSKFDIINNLNLSYLLTMGLTIDKVIQLGEKIENNTLSDEEIKEVIIQIKDHKSLLLKLGTLSDELQIWFYDKYPNELEYIKNPCDAIAVKQIEKDPNLIKNISNPSEDMQLAVVKQDGLLISLIEHPTTNVILEAVRQSGYILTQIPQELQTDEIIKEAMKTAPRIILTIPNPSINVIRAAITQEPKIIGLIEQTHFIPEDIKILAVSLDASAILELREVNEPLVKIALDKNASLIRNFQKGFPELKAYAIRKNPMCISVINNPNKDDIRLALSLNPNCANKIRNKDLVEEVLREIQDRNNDNLDDIDLEID